MSEIIEMAGIVAFMLELDAVTLSQELRDSLDVTKRVAEDILVGLQQIWLLPLVLPGLVAGRHRIEREIHRAHIERAHFRRKCRRGSDPILQRHVYTASGGDVDHPVATLLDA